MREGVRGSKLPVPDPVVGATARASRAGPVWTVNAITYHLNSIDIAWIKLVSPGGAIRSITHWEWVNTYRGHEVPGAQATGHG